MSSYEEDTILYLYTVWRGMLIVIIISSTERCM